MQPIRTGIFDLFTIGPGPSSSHTIGPMRAGHRFLQVLRGLDGDALARATGVTARLFGSLSATGRGTARTAPWWPGCWAIARKRWSRPSRGAGHAPQPHPAASPWKEADLTVSVDGVGIRRGGWGMASSSRKACSTSSGRWPSSRPPGRGPCRAPCPWPRASRTAWPSPLWPGPGRRHPVRAGPGEICVPPAWAYGVGAGRAWADGEQVEYAGANGLHPDPPASLVRGRVRLSTVHDLT